MESIGVGPWIAIVVAVGAVGILVGYWLGTKMGGHNTEPMRELNREHTAYKEDVREHFEQVSATMTRMVEDYREMYHHVAKGAEKLADMHHETVIEPPPKPEAITQDRPAGGEAADTPSADKEKASAASPTPREASSATAPTASGAAAKSSASSSATGDAGAGASSAPARPQDAAIRAAAEDAATSQKR